MTEPAGEWMLAPVIPSGEVMGEDGHTHIWTNADPWLFTRALRACSRCGGIQLDPDGLAVPDPLADRTDR